MQLEVHVPVARKHGSSLVRDTHLKLIQRATDRREPRRGSVNLLCPSETRVLVATEWDHCKRAIYVGVVAQDRAGDALDAHDKKPRPLVLVTVLQVNPWHGL